MHQGMHRGLEISEQPPDEVFRQRVTALSFKQDEFSKSDMVLLGNGFAKTGHKRIDGLEFRVLLEDTVDDVALGVHFKVVLPQYAPNVTTAVILNVQWGRHPFPFSKIGDKIFH